MIRLGSMLPQAFMIGITDLVDMIGAEKTVKWLITIGRELGENQGPGLEGAPEGDLNYLPICPFADELVRFIDMFGERPEEYNTIVEYVKEREAADKDKVECPAVASVLCLMHHAYRVKRAEMAGYSTLHLACKSVVTDNKPVYNEEAIEKAGVTKEDVDKILEKGVCVFKFVKEE
ncbi:MAG: hypothetical protein KAR76_00760 [Methanosarcinales archaeon]|nr:hypothetical protein [Methanosarcinales archaeon]